jgi:hypothetical protein
MKMENIDRFSKYYSGDLKQVEEELLFSELASNNSVRDEFKTFTMVNSSLSSIVSSYRPSEVSKSKLFAKAGFVVPIDAVTPKPVETAIPKIKPINKSPYFNSILQIAASSLITILVMLYLFDFGDDASKNFINQITDNTNIANDKMNEKAIMEDAENDSPVRKEIVYIYVDRFINSENELIDNEQIPQNDIHYSELIKSDDVISLHKNNYNHNNFTQLNTKIYNQLNIFSLQKSIKNNLEISLEHSFPWHLPDAKITPESYNKFNNMGIRVMYKVNDYLKLGGGINQSTFYTEFDGIASDGGIYSYRMQPNLTTYTTDISVNLYNGESLKPYIQLGVGANQAGIIISPALGIEYEVIEQLSLYFSGTLDYYRFVHNENWFNTQKFRLNYGISLKL